MAVTRPTEPLADDEPLDLTNPLGWVGGLGVIRYLQDRPRLTPVHHLLSAFEAGIIMVFLTNPLWYVGQGCCSLSHS